MTKFDNNDFHENFEKEYTLKEQKLSNAHEVFSYYYDPNKRIRKPSKLKTYNQKIKYKFIQIVLYFKYLKVVKYLNFEYSNIKEGKVSDEIFNKRKEICLSCPSLVKLPDSELGFCKSCGCGANPRARLAVKLTVAGTDCPLKKWGKEKASVRNTFENIRESFLGICVTVWYNVSRLWKRN